MPYILVDKSEDWKLSEWGGVERIRFDPANPKVPEFTSQWDSSEEKWLQYNVRAHLRGNKLRIEYHKEDNRHLAEYEDEIYWGVHILDIKNILTIKNGKSHGPSRWLGNGEEPCDGPGWKFEEISDGLTDRRRGIIWAIQRGQQGEFRKQVLDMDTCCAVTGETCESALEAAHIVPAHEGGPEHPSNGILLRADIHRLFDSNPPKFEICPEDGRVMPINGFRYDSAKLEGKKIPQGVHERIAQALEMRQESKSHT